MSKFNPNLFVDFVRNLNFMYDITFAMILPGEKNTKLCKNRRGTTFFDAHQETVAQI